MILGKNIRLYLVNGHPNGLIIAEIMNWSGHVMQAPRSSIDVLLNRAETSRTGIYILTGSDPNTPDFQLAYVGESDVIAERLRQHSRKQVDGGNDFWDKVTVITSKDANLTKGHVRFLESQMVEIALNAGRVNLQNKNLPSKASLPEADIADMAFFLEQIKIILPVLGLELLKEVPTLELKDEVERLDDAKRNFHTFEQQYKNIYARAQEIDGEFIVLEGSQALLEGSGTDSNYTYQALRNRLIEQKKMVRDETEGRYLFMQDTAFKSPSAASAVIRGRNDNGRQSWVSTITGKSYGDWLTSLAECPVLK